MGEPLYFVAGGEKLFKFFLREILANLCAREGGFHGSGVGGHRGWRLITYSRL